MSRAWQTGMAFEVECIQERLHLLESFHESAQLLFRDGLNRVGGGLLTDACKNESQSIRSIKKTMNNCKWIAVVTIR
eukprot:3475901-Amphidinium_carterae.1